jgi:methionine-rich copper-binding protein CopC
MNATNEGGTSGWSAAFSFTTAGVSAVERFDSELPLQYALQQNYPNPFNPSTVIRFATPKSGDVTLNVYDLLGKEVAVLVSQQLHAGNYSVQWRADVPSGTYIYRIQAQDFVETRKMLLIR